MDEETLETALLKALRRAPARRADELAEAVGLPRTNYGRPLAHHLRGPLERLLAGGFVEERSGRYRLGERGRRRLADEALGPDVPR